MLPVARLCRVLRRLAADRGGFSAVLTALMLTILIGFIGLGVDVGAWQWLQRDMQEAADHAVFAAASSYARGNSAATATQTGLAVAITGLGASSGSAFVPVAPGSSCYSDSDPNNVIICVQNRPPNFTYTPNAWGVNISQARPMWFSRILYSVPGTISAQAVALPHTSAGVACGMAIDPNSDAGFQASGNGGATLNACDLIVFASGAPAMTATGGAGVAAQNIFVDGTESADSSSTISPTIGSSLNTQSINDPSAQYFSDPYSHKRTPLPTNCQFTDGNYHGPGVYCGSDLTISGSLTQQFTQGLYVLWGVGLTVTGGTPTSDSTNCQSGGIDATAGVTIFLMPQPLPVGRPPGTGNGLNIQGCVAIDGPTASQTSNVNFFASGNLFLSRGGQVTGIAIWFGGSTQPQTDGHGNVLTDTIGGGGTVILNGAIYDPNRQLQFTGNSVTTGTCNQLDAWQINISGPATVALANNCSGAFANLLLEPGYSTLGPVGLAE
jgi:Flp pilus assembly protein TadG